MKLARAAIATVGYLIILLLVYYIHIQFFKVNVVFYAAIGDSALAALLMGLALVRLKGFELFGAFEKLLLISIWIIFGYALAISVPTVIDRSLSIYILEKLHQRGGRIRQDGIERVFTQEYLKEHRLVDVRLTEQMESGTIMIVNGCVQITPKGENIVRFSRFFRMHWLPKNRLLMGKYSDVLTDPFRSSLNDPDYLCNDVDVGTKTSK